MKYMESTRNLKTIVVRKIKTNEVKNYIKEIARTRAAGYDNICSKHLLDTIDNSSYMIKKLINEIINQEEIPKGMKIQLLRPIYKAGKKDDPANYRPISLLSAIEKIMEKHLHKIIYNFFKKYGILKGNQYAYQENKGVKDILQKVNCEFNKQIAEGAKIGIIFFDLCKAFDVIDREKLIRKLERYGIRGKMANIIKSYFKDRKICTMIDEEKSELKENKYGVPQGSCLGPLLFIAYLNDIFNINLNGKMFIYADDIMLFYSHVKEVKIIGKLNRDVSNIVKWAKHNSVFINKDKTKMMWVKNYKLKENKRKKSGITLHEENCKKAKGCKCKEIEEVQEYKYLGITWDKGLLWNKHIDKIKNKLRIIVIKLNNIKNHLTQEMAKLVYDAMVNSVLRFGIQCYGQASNQHIMKLDRIINIITKKLKHSNVGTIGKIERYRRLQALTTKQIWIKENIINTIKTNEVENLKINHNYNTRIKKRDNYRINKMGNRYKQRGYNCILPQIYNKIEIEKIKDMTKKQLSNYLNERLLIDPIII